jgi:hypothetical protein
MDPLATRRSRSKRGFHGQSDIVLALHREEPYGLGPSEYVTSRARLVAGRLRRVPSSRGPPGSIVRKLAEVVHDLRFARTRIRFRETVKRSVSTLLRVDRDTL